MATAVPPRHLEPGPTAPVTMTQIWAMLEANTALALEANTALAARPAIANRAHFLRV